MLTIGLIIGAVFGLWFAFSPLEKAYQKGMERAPQSEAGYNLFSLIWGIFLLFVFVAGSLTIGHLFLDCLYCEPMTFDDKLNFVVRAWTENPAMFLEGLIPCE